MAQPPDKYSLAALDWKTKDYSNPKARREIENLCVSFMKELVHSNGASKEQMDAFIDLFTMGRNVEAGRVFFQVLSLRIPELRISHDTNEIPGNDNPSIKYLLTETKQFRPRPSYDRSWKPPALVVARRRPHHTESLIPARAGEMNEIVRNFQLMRLGPDHMRRDLPNMGRQYEDHMRFTGPYAPSQFIAAPHQQHPPFRSLARFVEHDGTSFAFNGANAPLNGTNAPFNNTIASSNNHNTAMPMPVPAMPVFTMQNPASHGENPFRRPLEIPRPQKRSTVSPTAPVFVPNALYHITRSQPRPAANLVRAMSDMDTLTQPGPQFSTGYNSDSNSNLPRPSHQDVVEAAKTTRPRSSRTRPSAAHMDVKQMTWTYRRRGGRLGVEGDVPPPPSEHVQPQQHPPHAVNARVSGPRPPYDHSVSERTRQPAYLATVSGQAVEAEHVLPLQSLHHFPPLRPQSHP